VDLKELKKRLTYIVPGFEYTTAHRLYGWDGKRCLLKKDSTAPSGCIYRIFSFLTGIGHAVEIVFENNFEPSGKSEVLDLTLADFQVEAVNRAIQYRYGIIHAPVRAGKTAVIASVINKINHYPIWVITNGKDLVLQTKADLERHLGKKIGSFSEGQYQCEDIVVSSYQALSSIFRENVSDKMRYRNDEIEKAIVSTKVLLLDECHHAFAPKNSKCIKRFINVGYRIGLSGTPKPDKMHPIQLEETIGCVIYKVHYKKLIESGRLATPHVYLYDLPYAWFSKRLTEFNDIYESNVVENEFRNKFIAQLVAKLRKEKKTAFVMIRRLDHGPILRALIPGSVFVHGTIDSERRKSLYASLQNKKITCIIGSVGKEGLNIPTLDAVINAEGYKSSVSVTQKMRSLTATDGKSIGIIIDFMDKGKYLRKHSLRRQKQYMEMKGFIVKNKNICHDYFYMEATRWV